MMHDRKNLVDLASSEIAIMDHVVLPIGARFGFSDFYLHATVSMEQGILVASENVVINGFFCNNIDILDLVDNYHWHNDNY